MAEAPHHLDEPPHGLRLINNSVTARNESGVRTVATTLDGNSMVTDEPVSRGGTGTAPTPLETVIGALCGCSVVTFERAARQNDLAFAGVDFRATYSLDRRGLLGEARVRPYFNRVVVEAQVRTDAPESLLDMVVAVTEERCPVRNLLVDAGVELEIVWRKAPLAA